MKKLILWMTLGLLALAHPTTAIAGPATDKVGQCLSSATTTDEKKKLVRWIFIIMSSHPDLSTLTKLTAADKEASNKEVGALFTTLIGERCKTEMVAALKEDGQSAFESSFSKLGESAMGDLMKNPNVSEAAAEFILSLDLNMLARVMKEGGVLPKYSGTIRCLMTIANTRILQEVEGLKAVFGRSSGS
jgi:hypothetical protein